MTQTQISCFLTVAECGNFSKAAQKLYISQPAVSKQISLMETELGFPLFDRTRHPIQLTEAGRLFHTLYMDFKNEFHATVRKAQALSNSRQGEIRLGVTCNWDVSHLYAPIHALFESRFPSIRLLWEGYRFDDMLPALHSGTVDVIFALDSILKETPDLVRRKLTTVKSILIYPRRHPAAQKPALSLQDFKSEVFYVPAINSGTSLRPSALEQCVQAGFTPQIYDCYSFDSILMKIQTGGGVMFTDEWMMVKDSPLFGHLLLNYENTVDVCWLDNGSNPAKNLFVCELLFALNQADKGGEKNDPI